MGNQNTMQGVPLHLSHYVERGQYQLPWAERFTLLVSHSSKAYPRILKKVVSLSTPEQARALVEKVNSGQKLAFYLIRPLHAETQSTENICSQSKSVCMYHRDLLPTLGDKMRSSDSVRDEVSIWFLLNEVVHSLSILHESNQPHLWVSPETIFYNENENWFLQDMSCWWGADLKNLLEAKFKTKSQIMSQRMKQLLAQAGILDLPICYDEDVYCLGYTILQLMTGATPQNAFRNCKQIIAKCSLRYSTKLIWLIQQMIEENPMKRITFERLRIKLKADEEDIINQEIEQYKIHHEKQSLITHESMVTIPRKETSPHIYSSKIKRRLLDNEQNTEARTTDVFYSPPTERTRIVSHQLSPRPRLAPHRKNRVKQFELRFTSPRRI